MTDAKRRSKETYIAFLASLGIFAHLIARYGLHASLSQRQFAPLMLILSVGGRSAVVRPSAEDDPARVRLRHSGGPVDRGVRHIGRVPGRVDCRSHALWRNGAGDYATQRASAVLAALAKRMPAWLTSLIESRHRRHEPGRGSVRGPTGGISARDLPGGRRGRGRPRDDGRSLSDGRAVPNRQSAGCGSLIWRRERRNGSYHRGDQASRTIRDTPRSCA